jgi:hypothetical protein
MKKVLIALVLAGIAVSAPEAASAATTLNGIVISRSVAHGDLVIASANGHVTTLRAARLVAPGTKIRTSVFKLADGTYAAGKLGVTGHARHGMFDGVLVKTVGATSFFSAGGSVVAVHGAARSLSSARSMILAPGDAAEIVVTITATGLNEGQVTPTPDEDRNELTLQVIVVAVTPATATAAGSLTLTIDGQPLVLPLPAGTVLPAGIVANAMVALKFEFEQAGDNDNDNRGPGNGNGAGQTTTVITTTTTVPSTGSNGSGRDSRGGSGRDGGGQGGDGGRDG